MDGTVTFGIESLVETLILQVYNENRSYVAFMQRGTELASMLSLSPSSAEALFFDRLIEDVKTFALGLPMHTSGLVH